MTLEEQKQLILDPANIVDIISEYLPLKRKGQNYVCPCPFHDEKTGSFTVSPTRGIFKCFGCSETGNVFDFVMKHLNVGFTEAKNIVAAKCGVYLESKTGNKKNGPIMAKADPQDDFTFEKKEFSKYELTLLGPKITPEICKEFNLISLKSLTREKNEKGESWKIESTDDFPIFMYDFGTWGKIYQPLSEDYRFSYWGDMPNEFIFGNRKVRELVERKKRGFLPEGKSSNRHDDDDDDSDDRPNGGKLASLVICSGGTDAMNLYAETKRDVCFLNSETAELGEYIYKQIFRFIVKSKEIYVLFDLDRTGIEKAYNMGLRFIDLKIVDLPADLRRYRTRKGNPCKDVKDFFMHYKHPTQKNARLMENIIKTSLPLQFWDEIYDKEFKLKGYEINNQQLYGFLAALGIYRLPNDQSKRGFVFIHIRDKIVKVIPDDGLQSFVNEYLIKYLKENLDYYNVNLLNTIHRSNQVRIASLEKMFSIDLDFKSYGKDFDFLFFRNTAIKITGKGLKAIHYKEVGHSVYESKIIDFDFHRLDAPFQIEYTPEYLEVKRTFEMTEKSDINYSLFKKAYEKFDPSKRFSLKMNDREFSVIQYIYNTGRTFWRKEEAKIPLTEEEEAEHNLHFINKVMALGYLLFRYKDSSRPYMVYAMETDLNEVGTHMGGTGKSMFFNLIEFVRTLLPIDGQNVKKDSDETLFAGTHKGITDFIYFDDLHKQVDLHKFMPMATGNMAVRNLYENRVVLSFDDSPKVGFSSNHGIDKFDSSLRRRTWFTGFSSYYHPEDAKIGLSERSPRTEFGLNIPKDYSNVDMNRFYNFMAYCLHTYIKFGERINPPMKMIEKRMLQNRLTDEFIWWADEYLEGKLNIDIDKEEIVAAWKRDCLSEAATKNVRSTTLKKKMTDYCQYHGYIFNPGDLLITDTEKSRGEKRGHKDGKDIYYWHIRTLDIQNEIDNKDEVEF